MTIQVELNPEIEAQLAAEAGALRWNATLNVCY
jgi:hypothetical protein